MQKSRKRNIIRQKNEENYARTPLMAKLIEELKANDPEHPKTSKLFLKKRKIDSCKKSKI